MAFLKIQARVLETLPFCLVFLKFSSPDSVVFPNNTLFSLVLHSASVSPVVVA